jgi:hypothetical protein
VKGRIGETFVSVGALRRLDPKIHRIFNDIVLPRPDRKGTTQIDHVVVSPFGIFVIETKNYGGWIFGDEDSRYWTQTIYGKKSRFQNPLHQNALHVRALAIATGLPRDCFHNLVYFAGDATSKTSLPPQVMTEGLASYIRGHRAMVIPRKDVAWASAVLELARMRGRGVDRAQCGNPDAARESHCLPPPIVEADLRSKSHVTRQALIDMLDAGENLRSRLRKCDLFTPFCN